MGAKHAQNVDILVFLNAGGDDDPNDTQRLLQPILQGKADLVMGARVLKSTKAQTLHWHQLLGTKLIITFINIIFSKHFKDIGPFRAVTYDAYKSLNMQPKRFSWTTQMLIKALKQKMRVVEVSVHTQKRIGKSKISAKCLL